MPGVVLNSNLSSSRTLRVLSDNQARLQRSFERLSSGLRINRAADDAAGLAIASSLNVRHRVFTQAVRNINDGISALSIASSALGEFSSIATRLKELAEQSSNGTLSLTQRRSLDQEANQLTLELNRIVSSTRFNGQSLFSAFDGSLRIQGGIGVEAGWSLSIGEELQRNVGIGGPESATSLGEDGLFTVGDFDGDGNEDIVYGQSVGSGYRLMLGNGDGTFGVPTPIAASMSGTKRPSAADMDNDGDLDLALWVNGRINTYLNDGLGVFTLKASVNKDMPLTELADVTGDGILDLVGHNAGYIHVFSGIGDGTFSNSSSQYAITGTFQQLKTSDLNADGLLDIAVAADGGASGIQILFGRQGGGFDTALTFGTEKSESLAIGDIDHNGTQDIVYGSSGQVHSLLGDGAGAFSQGASVSVAAAGATSVFLGDFDNDGQLDLAASVLGSLYSSVFIGDGAGSFNYSWSVTSGDIMVQAHDFDRDGVLDLIHGGNGNTKIYLQNSKSSTSVSRLDLTTQRASRESLDAITDMLNRIGLEVGSLGALQSRLEVAAQNLQSMSLELRSASSRITDIDVAVETAELTRFRILQELGARVLAQSNLEPQRALELLRAAG